MTSSLTRVVQPAAMVLAVLLAAVTVQTEPADAAPRMGNGALIMWTRAMYPYARTPGYWGDTPDLPADAGNAPGSVTFGVHVQNGGEPLRDITIAPRVVTNGHVDAISCSTAPLPDDVLPPVDPPLGSARRTSTHQASDRATTPSWSDPDLVLPPSEHLSCTVTVSGITDKVVSEIVTTTTGVGQRTGRTLSGDDGGAWAAAGALRPPPPPAASVSGAVWLDRNDDGNRGNWKDPTPLGLYEPALSGAHLTITGPDGKPVPSYPSGQGVLAPFAPDADGYYRIDHVRPYVNAYTVTLDLGAPDLAGLVKSRRAPGTVSADGKTWSQKVYAFSDGGWANFRLVPKDRLGLSTRGPWTTNAGTTIKVTGRAERADTGAWDGPVVLESYAGGTRGWKTVARTVSREGAMAVKVRLTRSTHFRFRSPGDSDTPAAVSPEFHVVVYLAPVTIDATAPRFLAPGAPLTVSATMTRAGEPFSTGHVKFQQALDGGDWTTLADVRSTDGTLSATVKPGRTGFYRYLYLGDSITHESSSHNLFVEVTSSAAKSSPTPRRR